MTWQVLRTEAAKSGNDAGVMKPRAPAEQDGDGDWWQRAPSEQESGAGQHGSFVGDRKGEIWLIVKGLVGWSLKRRCGMPPVV